MNIPAKIKIKDGRYLQISWKNGQESLIKLKNLRRNCPCAECGAERDEEGKNYIPLFNDDQVTITDIKLSGSYAVQIFWKDGHNTGIFTFDTLKNLEEQGDK